jgi:outer membrane receptor protein involved in Fe transport
MSWLVALLGPLGPLGAEAQDGGEYGAAAEVEPVETTEIEVDSDELATLPTAFGDPFRVLETLPGTAPVQTASPYVAVRGAPPSSTIYFYDDIALPAIAHLAAGPTLFHPRVIGELEFDPGVAPARYGRFTGAVVSATAATPETEPFGEVELRLLDLAGVVDLPLGDSRIQAATHIGYPGLVYQLTSPETTFQYYDYLARFEHHFGEGDSFHAIALGSYDDVVNPPWTRLGDLTATLRSQFHRLELRFVHEHEDAELGAALKFGFDDSDLGETLFVTAVTVGPRVWASFRNDDVRVRVGADFIGSFGDIDDPPGGLMGPFGTIGLDLPIYAQAAARETTGVYGELAVQLADEVELQTGLRGDLWITSDRDVDAAPSPRLELVVTPIEGLRLHAGGALNFQPAVYAFPIPGLTETSIDRGLQRSIQSEIGAVITLPEDIRIDATLFVNHFQDIILVENNWGWERVRCTFSICHEERAPERSEVLAHGGELMIRRRAETGLSGWLAYTLAWNEATGADGHRFTPVLDTRHVLNLLASYEFEFGLVLGARLLARSGQMSRTPIVTRDFRIGAHAERLPATAHVDVRVGYDWGAPWAELGVYAEFLNVTFTEEPGAVVCPMFEGDGPCRVLYAPAVWAPNAGFRATF